MASSKPSLPKGTRDFGPKEAARRSYLIQVIRQNFVKYGFSQIETPALELLSTLAGKYGEEGDKLLYKIRSNKNLRDKLSAEQVEILDNIYKFWLPQKSDLALHYDLTVPFARFVVQHQHEITFPFRRFQIQPVWRADRPQKGRYREFYQCDADIIGSDGLWNEAELTLLIHDVFADLKYDGFLLKINHREILMALARCAGLEGKEMPFCVVIDKLDKIGREAVVAELLTLGATEEQLSPVLNLFDLTVDNAQKLEMLTALLGENKGIAELNTYFALLAATGKSLRIELDFSLARGLSYYTGVIFEVKATDVQIGSITGGGRYDNLTGVFGLPGISGVGISFGLDRIYDVLDARSLFPEGLQTSTQLLITHLDEACMVHGAGLLQQLRAAGIASELYPDVSKFKKQMNYADKKQIPWVMVIGATEMETGQYGLKDMRKGTQESLALTEIIHQLQKD